MYILRSKRGKTTEILSIKRTRFKILARKGRVGSPSVSKQPTSCLQKRTYPSNRIHIPGNGGSLKELFKITITFSCAEEQWRGSPTQVGETIIACSRAVRNPPTKENIDLSKSACGLIQILHFDWLSY